VNDFNLKGVQKIWFRSMETEFAFGKDDAQFKHHYAAHYADVEHSLSVRCLIILILFSRY
jgi:hypothetical protein